MVTENIVAPLFVPATRLDRIQKAALSGADAIIVDLEDAVSPDDKNKARKDLSSFDFPKITTIVRINAAGTVWHEEDLRLVAQMAFDAIMLPKSEDPATIVRVHDRYGKWPILALVETAVGVANARLLATTGLVERLIFGSLDYAADLGCAHAPESLLFARSELVIASKISGLPPPIDGVTMSVDDLAAVEADAVRAANLGFTGKLCIHPRQIQTVFHAMAPSAEEVEWANKVLMSSEKGVAKVDGLMIDAPVRKRASQIIGRANAATLPS